VCPGLLGSQVPPAQSQKVPPLEICAMVRCAVAPTVVARPEVPADQWVDDRCSSVPCGEYEPPIIDEEKSVR
jgi:hypothetical protein